MASSLLYKRRWRLKQLHQDSITGLDFSPSGTYLASTSIDGRLCVWATSSGEALHTVEREGAGFMCVTWVNEAHLVAGMEDGVLVSVKITQVWISTG